MTPAEYAEYIQDLKNLKDKLQPILDGAIETCNLTPEDACMVNALFADEIDSAKETFDSQQFLELASEHNFDQDIDHSEPHEPTDLERAHMAAQADYLADLSPEDIEAVKHQLDLEELATMERNKIQ